MKASKARRAGEMPGVPAAEALSFLKETKGVVSWVARDLAKALNLTAKEAQHVLAVLELQGYVKPVQEGRGEWLTTPAGDVVSGAKTPRFSRESVEEALAALKERMKALNRDPNADFKVSEAVAFGDFLSERPRVQAADVGVRMVRRDPDGHEANSAVEHGRRRAVLRELRGRSALVNLVPYAEWMGHRAHRKLV